MISSEEQIRSSSGSLNHESSLWMAWGFEGSVRISYIGTMNKSCRCYNVGYTRCALFMGLRAFNSVLSLSRKGGTVVAWKILLCPGKRSVNAGIPLTGARKRRLMRAASSASSSLRVREILTLVGAATGRTMQGGWMGDGVG